MDLAKMLAVPDLIAPLERPAQWVFTPNFRIWRQTRTGLLSYPADPNAARAQLATSVYLQMALRPHIVHIVGHTEADHAATADDVIEACELAQRAIENALRGQPETTSDPAVQPHREELVRDAEVTLDAIRIDRRGACVAVDPVTGRAHSEEDRIASLDIRTDWLSKPDR